MWKFCYSYFKNRYYWYIRSALIGILKLLKQFVKLVKIVIQYNFFSLFCAYFAQIGEILMHFLSTCLPKNDRYVFLRLQFQLIWIASFVERKLHFHVYLHMPDLPFLISKLVNQKAKEFNSNTFLTINLISSMHI